jgi:hypothetical protein
MSTNTRRAQILRSGSPHEKAKLLYSITAAAIDLDQEVLDGLEALLEDSTVVQMSIPYRYGELRYAAAQALAEIRAQRGDLRTIVLARVPAPLSGDRIYQLCQAHGLSPRGGATAEYQELRDRGHLPCTDEVFDPRAYLE